MSIEISLRAVKEAYMEENVKVIVVADYDVDSYMGKRIALRKGEEVELPRWIANALSEKGIVKLKTPYSVSVGDLSRYAFLESRSSHPSSLQALPKNIYLEYREYISSLSKQLKENFNPEIFEELRKAENFMNEIVRYRLSKILRVALGRGTMKEIVEKMTREELILFREISNIIEKWEKIVLEG